MGKLGLGVQNEVEQRLTVLPRERTSHSKHHLAATQEVAVHMDITRWPTTISILIILFSAKDAEAKDTVSKNKTRS